MSSRTSVCQPYCLLPAVLILAPPLGCGHYLGLQDEKALSFALVNNGLPDLQLGLNVNVQLAELFPAHLRVHLC